MAQHGERTTEELNRDRAIRVFRFLTELAELRTNKVRDIDQYDRVIWLQDIPKEDGCYCIAWPEADGSSGEVWLEVSKPSLPDPPDIPVLLRPWLNTEDVRNSELDLPTLREEIVVRPDPALENSAQGAELHVQRLEDNPDVERAWEDWVDRSWWPWAQTDRPLQAVRRVYQRLFATYQQQDRMGETYELVLGLGFLSWRTPTNQGVRRHLVTARVRLEFDIAGGRLRLVPNPDGVELALEQDMLEQDERPGTDELRQIEDLLKSVADAVWQEDGLHQALRAWVNAVPDSHDYLSGLEHQDDVDDRPRVHFAPALILRRRTEKSLLTVYQRIREQLEDAGTPMPQGLVAAVRDADTERRDAEESDVTTPPLPPQDIYFPLVANDAQLRIAHAIEASDGVLVQGPPGTGKSHTIVNVVCHLLAHGRRVLVTSHTARALSVLREMLPPELLPLCVVAIGEDEKSKMALEQSVAGITDHYNKWDAAANGQAIAACQGELDSLRRREAELNAELRSIVEREDYEHPPRYGDYRGTLKLIAARLREEDTDLKWLPDFDENIVEPPLTDAEAAQLLGLLRDLTAANVEELSLQRPSLAVLCAPDEFAGLVKEEKAASDALAHYAEIMACPQYQAMKGTAVELRANAVVALSGYVEGLRNVTAYDLPWVRDAVGDVLGGMGQPFVERAKSTRQMLEDIGKRPETTGAYTVHGLEAREPSAALIDAQRLLEHLHRGGTLGRWVFRAKVVKDTQYLWRDTRINGEVCASVQALGKLIEWLDVECRLRHLDSIWSDTLKPREGTHQIRAGFYWDTFRIAYKIYTLGRLLAAARQAMSAMGTAAEVELNTIPAVESVLNAVRALDVEERAIHAREALDRLRDDLEQIRFATRNWAAPNAEEHASRSPGGVDGTVNTTHPVLGELLTATAARHIGRYADAHRAVATLDARAEQLRTRNALLERLESAVPSLVSELTGSAQDTAWDQKMPHLSAAWNWQLADKWFQRVSDPLASRRLENELQNVRSEILHTTSKLASLLAWRHCLQRLTESESEHLRAWQMAVRRIGKGTGKNAPRYRREAREHMAACRGAIPAWIMPLYRVAATMDVEPDSFDVVIIDEASQSGPEALLLHFLGKKMLVVGDDKQISPSFVGVTKADVDLLRERWLEGVPQRDSIGTEHSFYDLAYIRYPTHIHLVEHFRCVPEIIQFSNQVCYRANPLIPLRQYGAGRLRPAIKTEHVTDGYQRGRGSNIVNQAEADRLVASIELCCGDDAYSGKTMGVISLLGNAQAQLIQEMLIERLGPDQLEERGLHCGDAYAFQGDERDVMFLSMVSAPGEHHRIGVLADDAAEQRFNVAASRAREQMWLFHSVSPSDLSAKCMRRKLLEYCLNPTVDQTELRDVPIDALRTKARDAERARERAPRPFESWFELDVFLAIGDKGYRVIPQYQVAGYRIDMIVEGMRGRVAVECDGDAWHGPERYEADIGRQRQLERSGYVFWRIRESVFRRDPEAALQGLWRTLEAHGVRPEGQSAVHGDDAARQGWPTTDDGQPEVAAAVVTEELTGTPMPLAGGPQGRDCTTVPEPTSDAGAGNEAATTAARETDEPGSAIGLTEARGPRALETPGSYEIDLYGHTLVVTPNLEQINPGCKIRQPQAQDLVIFCMRNGELTEFRPDAQGCLMRPRELYGNDDSWEHASYRHLQRALYRVAHRLGLLQNPQHAPSERPAEDTVAVQDRSEAAVFVSRSQSSGQRGLDRPGAFQMELHGYTVVVHSERERINPGTMVDQPQAQRLVLFCREYGELHDFVRDADGNLMLPRERYSSDTSWRHSSYQHLEKALYRIAARLGLLAGSQSSPPKPRLDERVVVVDRSETPARPDRLQPSGQRGLGRLGAYEIELHGHTLVAHPDLQRISPGSMIEHPQAQSLVLFCREHGELKEFVRDGDGNLMRPQDTYNSDVSWRKSSYRHLENALYRVARRLGLLREQMDAALSPESAPQWGRNQLALAEVPLPGGQRSLADVTDTARRDEAATGDGNATGSAVIRACPYTPWQARPLPDPRSAPRADVVDALLEIVEAEGPIVCRRAYQLYAQAAGLQRVGKNIKSALNRALADAVRSGRLAEADERGEAGQHTKVVRIPGSAKVLLRMRGDRTIDEIPPLELAAAMRKCVERSPSLRTEPERLYRCALDHYELTRMTDNTRSAIEHAYRLYVQGSDLDT